MLLRVRSRAESAAATRRSLIEAAGALLDLGGVEAVTLREGGARSGVSRSAAYSHFADKESLLTVLATNALTELGDVIEEWANSDDSPEDSLRPRRPTRPRGSAPPSARRACCSTSLDASPVRIRPSAMGRSS